MHSNSLLPLVVYAICILVLCCYVYVMLSVVRLPLNVGLIQSPVIKISVNIYLMCMHYNNNKLLRHER